MKLLSENLKNSNPKQSWGNHRSPCSWLIGLLTLLLAFALPETGLCQADGWTIGKQALGPTLKTKAHVGDPITCTIRIANVDSGSNTIVVRYMADAVHHITNNLNIVVVALTNRVHNVPPGSKDSPGSFTNVTFSNYSVLPSDGDILSDLGIAIITNLFDGPGQLHMPLISSNTFPASITVLRPCIVVSNVCTTPSGAGMFTFNGTVKNCNLTTTPLHNVYVSNLVNGVYTYVLGPITLATNQSMSFTQSFPANGSCAYTNTICAVGTDELETTGSTVSACSTAVCSNGPLAIYCPPALNLQCLYQVPPADPNSCTALTCCPGPVSKIWLGDVTNTVVPGCYYIITRTYKATDSCGNMATCTQTITVRDTIYPLVYCPPDLTVECTDPTDTPHTGVATATDNCIVTNISYVDLPDPRDPNCTGKRSILRTWIARDGCGNQASCVQTISFRDTVPPQIYCPADITVTGIPGTHCGGKCETNANWDPPRATDNCDPHPSVSCYPPSGSIFCLGVNTVTCTAKDACGNSSACTFKVTVLGGPGCTDCAALGDFVWSDLNGNGCQDPGEPGLNNVTVNLLDCSGQPVLDKNTHLPITTVTANGPDGKPGYYLFTNLKAGSYVVQFVNPDPARYSSCLPYNCGDLSRDSNADPLTGVSECITLGQVDPCENNRTVDACFGPQKPCVYCPTSTGQVGVPYSSKLVVGCGVIRPFILSIPSGSLPPGLVLDASTGDITGTPTEAGNFPFTVMVVDVRGIPAGQAVTNCNITITGMGGCRVTGGSNHQLNSYQSSCITTPLPSHISHGGQVGAPFSVGSPFTPNDPCISGEWQHYRHLKGNSLVGNFHASGNGNQHQFDSLLCACLPCPQNLGAIGVVGGNCNPGDRVCGPEPSKAPANKICFSGVGDYTFTNGKKTVKAVFRVDIEDRGEGNSQSSTSPPDRYRMRIWILDPSCGRNPDPSSSEAMSIRYAASADPVKIASLATTEDLKVNITPDIDDGGDMTQGNHQIHKPTGATCKAVIPAPAAAIDIATEVAALTPSGSTFGMVAQGYQGAQDPAFAYRMTISNPGSVTLGNLTVFETTGTDMVDRTSMYFAPGATLAPGATVVKYCTNAWPLDMVDTLIVSGNSVQDGTAVSSAGTAMASVGAAEVTCNLTLSSSSDLDGNPSDNHLKLPSGTSSSVQMIVQVCNTGQADLTGLTVVDNWLNCSRPTFDLAAGACTNLTCTANLSCPGLPLLPQVTVTGRVKPAIYNTGGAIITVGSGCSGSVDGCLQAPVICGFVLRDCAGNGDLSGARGLAGWTVTLSFKNRAVGTKLTDVNGAYCFDQLSAKGYTIAVSVPANYAQSVDPDGTLDNTATVTLAAGETRTGVNFGYKGTAPAVTLAKTGPASAKRGDTVTYHFKVSNTGNTCFTGGITVDDPALGGTIWSKTPVAVGEVNEFDKTYVISATDNSPLVNTATAVGHPASGSTATASSTWTITLPPAPSGLAATPDNAQVTLSWSAFSGATSYNVKRSTSSGGPYTTVKAGVTTTTYVDAGLVNGTTYYYVVSAVTSGGESANSIQVSAKPAIVLPSPWQTRDVGSVAAAGTASYAGSARIWTLTGSGADIAGTADGFRYVYQSAVGDCSIVARVTSVQSPDPWMKAGVMIRETLTAGSTHASVFVTPGNGVASRSRASTGGTSAANNTTGLTAPYWVKVVRSGSTFTSYYSANGSTWTTMGSVSIPMGANVFIGLGVTSHNDGTLSTATFDNVTATP